MFFIIFILVFLVFSAFVIYELFRIFFGRRLKFFGSGAKGLFQKSDNNPILSPQQESDWKSVATFNPAAIYLGGKIHILYRAMGSSWRSVLGYMSGQDGIHFDAHLPHPVYSPREPFELAVADSANIQRHLMSGGGLSGCEDPRLVEIEGRVYLTYVAFNGYNLPRIALTSISVKDFLNHRWNWRIPKLISRPGEIDKSCVIFPEKIKGKYVIFHRVFPNLLIDFVDDLEFRDGMYLKGEYAIKPRANTWDSRKIGAGATPIKTKEGWLLITYGVDDRDASKYKIGAMLLDLNDPTKVLYRADAPMLEPEEWYENEGHKAGVVYPGGAVLKDGTVFVYYGGADKHSCVAYQKLDTILRVLKRGSKVSLAREHAQVKAS